MDDDRIVRCQRGDRAEGHAAMQQYGANHAQGEGNLENCLAVIVLHDDPPDVPWWISSLTRATSRSPLTRCSSVRVSPLLILVPPFDSSVSGAIPAGFLPCHGPLILRSPVRFVRRASARPPCSSPSAPPHGRLHPVLRLGRTHPRARLLADAFACFGAGSPAGSKPSPVFVEPDSGEHHLRNLRQLTFGGNNAEAYFSPSGRELIFQRQESLAGGCDQQY